MISFPMNTVLIINLVVTILIITALLIGYFNGFIKQVSELIVLIGSIIIAWPISNVLSESIPILSRDLSMFDDILFGQFAYEISNIFVWFFILLILLSIGLHQILKPFVKQLRQTQWIKPLDKILGVVIALVPQMIWILLFMIISISPIFVNGRSTLESSIVSPLVPVAQSLSDQFVKQVDPYGIVVKVTQNQELTEEDVSNIPVWLETFGVPEKSVVIVEKFINEEELVQEDIDVVQEYIDDHEISEAQARSFLERFGLSQTEIDAAVAEFQFNQ
ncbi:MAG: CvpA family protein [Erysipelotrichaceae bacterium]|nr:CvpA family protein [Erysipelotrichaceae bacterium]